MTIDPQFQRRLLAASGFAELSLFQEAVEEQVRAAPKIEQSKRIRVHALVSSSASVVPRLAQNPISGGVSHGAADKADNAGLNQLEITARPELPPKGTPEIFISFAWGDDSSEDARTEVVDRLCETLGQHGWHILRDSNVLRSGDLISGFMKRMFPWFCILIAPVSSS